MNFKFATITFFLIVFAGPLYAQQQPNLQELENKAVAGVEEFTDKNLSVEDRLGAADDMLWLTMAKESHRKLVSRIQTVAEDQSEPDKIRTAAFLAWRIMESSRASDSMLNVLKSANNGGYRLRCACVGILTMEAKYGSNQEYKKKIERILYPIMVGDTDDDILTRQIVITSLATLTFNDWAIGCCAQAIADNLSKGTRECPITVAEALNTLAEITHLEGGHLAAQRWKVQRYVRPALNNRDPKIRLLAIHILEMDDASFETFVSMLKSPAEDAAVRIKVAFVVGYRHPHFPELIIPLIKETENDEIRAGFIKSFVRSVVESDWLAEPDNRKRFKEFAELANQWSRDFQGDSKVQAALAADHFRRLQKD